jgi:hypothetical protein
MVAHFTDTRSNHNDQIASAVKALGHSPQRIAVFLAIHSTSRRIKTVGEIAARSKLNRKRVLEEGKKLVNKGIITQTKRDGDTAYERDNFFYAHRRQIVSLAQSPAKLRAYPTKYSARPSGPIIKLPFARALVKTAVLTVDDLDSFRLVKKVKVATPVQRMLEKRFKHGVQRIIGEAGRFDDWGGETSDLFTTRVRYKQKRTAAAFAFKGRGTSGVLTPGRLGKNGDQIQRLFMEDADIFFVQYIGQIASSVMQQMAVFAQNKSIATGRKIFYGTIDGADSARLVSAYPKAFRTAR